jgi:hypothetical protein
MNRPAIALTAVLTAACISFEEKSTLNGPGATGLAALMGSWGSTSLVPSPSSCADFKWNVTERTSTSASGSFSATCAGDLKVEGTASGTQAGSLINWNAAGTATVLSLASCPITLSGTAELGTDEMRVPYSGMTCLGPVSGTEILKRH